MARIAELRPIAEIRIEPDGKFYKVTGHKFGGDAVDELERPRADISSFASRYADLDDEIPF